MREAIGYIITAVLSFVVGYFCRRNNPKDPKIGGFGGAA